MVDLLHAFVAVHAGGRVDVTTIRGTIHRAEDVAGDRWPGGWPEAQRAGWRILPVVILVEDKEGSKL